MKNNFSGHHAYCVQVNGREVTEAFVRELCKIFEIERNSPDLIILSVQKFGIDEAREFRAWASNRAVGGKKKIFVLSADSITSEAQNALLKTFEEPSSDTKFFLLVKTPDVLLPTLRSRMEIARWTPSVLDTECSETLGVQSAQDFLAAALPERLAKAREISEALKKEKISRGEVISFISNIVSLLRDKIKLTPETSSSVRDALLAEKYSYDRSASLKMLLEHLAVMLPKI